MAEKKSFWSEFKTFIARGNVMDMAVGVVVGGAFTAIVNSLVGDIINPLIGKLFGGVDLSEAKVVLTEATEETAEVKKQLPRKRRRKKNPPNPAKRSSSSARSAILSRSESDPLKHKSHRFDPVVFCVIRITPSPSPRRGRRDWRRGRSRDARR